MPKRISKKPLAKTENENKESVSEKVKKTKIRVVGIGGGGGNIISELSQKVEKATFWAANTDLQALKGLSKKVERFPFGQNLTRGLGTGMNPEIGEIAVQNEKDRIKKILQGQDLTILVASLGGGTGSGAAPIFAKIAKSFGNLVLGIFTLPFKFEGERKMEIARTALEKVKSKLNAVVIIPNERIFQIIGQNTPLKEAFSAVNENLSSALEGLIEIIYEPGLINIDFADLKTILQGQGRLAYLNTAQVPRKEGAAEAAIEKALNSSLYSYSIRGARGVLYNIAGEKELNLEEVSKISKTILEKSNKEAKIIFGVSQGRKYKDTIKTTILATGLSAKTSFAKPPNPQKPRKKKTKIKTAVKRVIIEKRKPLQKKPSPKNEVKPKEAKEEKKEVVPSPLPKTAQEAPKHFKIRKNALQIRKEIEEAEKEMLEEENFWETPAFLKRKLSRG